MLHLSVDEYHMRSVWWPYGGSFPSNASAFDVQLRSRRLKGIFRSRYTILDRPIEGLDGASRLARPLLDPELDTTNRRCCFRKSTRRRPQPNFPRFACQVHI